MVAQRFCFSMLSATLSLVSSSWPLRRLCRMPFRWRLGRLVLAEVVDDLVAERDHPEELPGAGGLAGVEVLDRPAQLEQGVADLGALGDAALLERPDRGLQQPVGGLGGLADVGVAHAADVGGLRGELRRAGLGRHQRVHEAVDLGVQQRHGWRDRPAAPSPAPGWPRPSAVGAGAVRVSGFPSGGVRGAGAPADDVGSVIDSSRARAAVKPGDQEWQHERVWAWPNLLGSAGHGADRPSGR